nr:ComF family protein [Arenimonas composti]
MFGRLRRGWPALLWPPCCVVCGGPGAGGRDLCAECVAALPWNIGACPRCALPMTPQAGPDKYSDPGFSPRFCPDCRESPPPFARTVAACRYGFPLDRLLPRFKFHADLAAGRLAAQLLGDAVAAADAAGAVGAFEAVGAVAAGPVLPPPVLVPLPLHTARLRERGYDQALELARPLARRFGLLLRADLLRRVRATAPQTGLHAGERRRNLAGAFVVRPGPLPPRVVLVDDVMTTGASLGEAAATLRAAGVAQVEVWVVARALPPGAAGASDAGGAVQSA